MLELDDIQHFLVGRPRALAARYEFLSFQRPAGGREWLRGLRKIGFSVSSRSDRLVNT